MQEFVTNAITLRKYPQGDLDGRYTLLTERFGKITAKAKSSRKITSKLAPHLEPGTLMKMRFIESPGTQVVDALKSGSLRNVSLADLHFLSMLLPEAQAEPELWNMLVEQRFSWTEALTILGWDPNEAICANCGLRKGTHFYIPRQDFFCTACVNRMPSKLAQSTVLSLYGGAATTL